MPRPQRKHRPPGHPDFAITWSAGSRTWRLLMGGPAGQIFVREYFGVAKYGGPIKAKRAARARRDELLQRPDVAEYYRYRLRQTQVRAARRNSALPTLGGVSFAKGWDHRPGRYAAYPYFVAQAPGHAAQRYSINKHSAYVALERAARARWKMEGRRFSRAAVNAAFEAWQAQPSVKKFFAKTWVPLRPEDLPAGGRR